MDAPVVASRKPYYAVLKKGRPYRWCRCGLSKKQPYCDNSHEGTGFEPLIYVGQYDGEEVLFCGCKQTGDSPMCDGTHANLEGGYQLDDPDTPENRAIAETSEQVEGLTLLDGGCYVFSPSKARFAELGALRFCTVISQGQGAIHQSQFYAEIEGQPGPIVMLGDSDGILFVGGGEGTIEIAGKPFQAQRTDGVYVRAGEGFRAIPAEGQTLKLFVSALPAIASLEVEPDWPQAFDETAPERVVRVDAGQRKAMGERWFQMLADKAVGCTAKAQFIGHIPFSKAEPHRHLYEESIICLEGEGMMWTETRKARVRPGDVIFLPRKQLHSLQCVSEGGMEVVGVIHPGDNPGINY
jgi:CDGSH-type Zn-finger protein/mannose-6-phosphate isomerase-like protein (cupin superfamily)